MRNITTEGSPLASFSLYARFTEQGTLSEPKGVPDPRYALPSSVNWIRALAVASTAAGLDFSAAFTAYESVRQKTYSLQQENSVFEHLLLGLHQLSALRAMAKAPRQADVARVATVAWYYGIYDGATAMVAAQDGTLQDNHTKTARNWDQQLAARGLILYPFDLRTTTLLKKDAKAEIDAARRGPPRNLVDEPKTVDDAHDCLCAYLSGCVEWWSWRIREELLASPEFVKEGLTNFKTKKARELRDQRLGKRSLSFLHEAIRFRGKANYREALYLAHGRSVEATVARFTTDMADTLEAFLAMAAAFAFRRLGPTLTNSFIEDISGHRSFSLDPADIWCVPP